MNTTKILALRKPLLISAWLLAMQGAAYAQNPIVQTQLTTDPAPLVVGDRLYVYTGHDEDKADFFWMNEWRVYSTKDMVNWTDHGSPLDLSSFSWADDRAWAAQTIERNGKYYWYICAAQARSSAQEKELRSSGDPWSVQFTISLVEYTRHSFIQKKSALSSS